MKLIRYLIKKNNYARYKVKSDIIDLGDADYPFAYDECDRMNKKEKGTALWVVKE